MTTVEKWAVFEVSANGRVSGKEVAETLCKEVAKTPCKEVAKTPCNPFVDCSIRGVFKSEKETVAVDGFYDGDGVYKVRFMPSFEGTYTYELFGNYADADTKKSGCFTVTPPEPGNHGPVRVANTHHFAYEDGTPYYSIGTTCYVWTHQSEALQQKTLETLKNGYFNKVRFCIFPKHYDYNFNEPITYPYEGTPMDSSVLTKDNFMAYTSAVEGNDWDFSRFNPTHFQLFEQRIQDLMTLGIEADLIVMHPYDRWGFSEMTAEQDDLYWRYIIARFAAYRNVWWSLANEYDLMTKKTLADWERYASIICEHDPYNHLRSIHNCLHFYDYKRPWITHCSIQRVDLHKSGECAAEWRDQYGKPVVLDEIGYEGNISHCWGNISGPELTRRFWEATIRGGYAGHGETYVHPSDILWWSHGGELHGDSHERLRFLHGILCETPGIGLIRLAPAPLGAGRFSWDDIVAVPCELAYAGCYYLLYFGNFRPSFREYDLDEENTYEVEVIDTWAMTIKKAGTYRGRFRVELPGREYMALRIRRC